MGKFESIAPNAEPADLTSENIEAFIFSIVNKENVLYDHNIIFKALQGLRISMHVNDAEARVTLYCSQFFNRLNGIGYGKFRQRTLSKLFLSS